MGSTSFLVFSCPNLLRVFLNLLFLGTCYIFFRKCWDFLWSFLFFSVPYIGLAVTTEIRLFALKSKKEKVPYWIEVRTAFNNVKTIGGQD